MFSFKRILVPIDFSRQSRYSLDNAILLAKKNKKSQLILLHVLPPVRAIDFPGPLLKEMDRILERQKENSEAKLKGWRKAVPSSISCSILTRRGKTAPEIINACQSKLIDVVVLTTHGAQGLKRISRPNLSEAIVRSAPCPVLVCHIPPAKGVKR